MEAYIRYLICILALLVAAFALTYRQDTFASGLSYSDEGPHFLNVFFFADYAQHHFGENPITVAKDIYLHYPKLALGHWPPLSHGLMSLPFLVFPLSTFSIMMLNTLVAITPAWYIIYILGRRVTLPWLLLGCVIWALLPINQFAYRYFMIDQLLAFVILAATVAWVKFSEKPGIVRAACFGFLAGAALLIKANAAVLILVPVLHALFTKGFSVLARNRYTYLAAVLPLIIAGPWYAFTYTIPAKGMSYHAGVDYAVLAITSNLSALLKNLSVPGVIFLVAGVFDSWLKRHLDSQIWSWASASVAVLLSVLAFHAIVPIALDERYLSTSLPAAIVLIILGVRASVITLERWLTPGIASTTIGSFFVIMSVPSLVSAINLEKKVDLRMREVAQTILTRGGPSIWAIDGGGGSGPEGALAAELASIDEGHITYLMRGSKAFTESDFLGRSIQPKYHRTDDILNFLREVGVQGVVICRNPANPSDFVNNILQVALDTPDSGYKLANRLHHRHREGETLVYIFEGVVHPNVDALRSINVPRIDSKG